MNKYLLCLTCSVVALTSSHLAVASPLDTSHIHTQHTLGLKPISSLEDSYNLAAAVFLPDAQDGFGFASNTLDNKYETSSGNCAGFALSSCPAHAKCSKCTFDTKYKITSCDTNYKQSANACIAKTCSEINGGYKADVPTNQICNITNTSVRTCYSSCRTVNTSGYPLDTCPSGAKCTTAPECGTTSTTKGNCSPVKQKVTGCTSSTQKVNSTATACIDKDDTCPTNYFKSCETGTQGDPKYTEKGTACYQCKPACNTAIYKYNTTNCTSPKQLAGSECGGNYEKCEIPCGSEYIYDESNCPSNRNYHCYNACGDKYKDCKAALFTGTIIKKNNMYYTTDEKYCPGTIKRHVIFGNVFMKISNGLETYYACTTADQTCADLAKSLFARGNSNDTEVINLSQDIYCGNEMLRNENSWYGGVKTTINGNGHTITFDKPTGTDIYLPGDGNKKMGDFTFNNVKIISKTSGAYDTTTDACNRTNGSSSRQVFKRSSYYNDQLIILQDSTVQTDSDIGNPVYRGTCYVNGSKK